MAEQSHKRKPLQQSEAIALAGEFVAGGVLQKLSHFTPKWPLKGHTGKWAAPKMTLLEQELMLERTTIRRALDRLEAKGLIERELSRRAGLPRQYVRLTCGNLHQVGKSHDADCTKSWCRMPQVMVQDAASHKEREKNLPENDKVLSEFSEKKEAGSADASPESPHTPQPPSPPAHAQATNTVNTANPYAPPDPFQPSALSVLIAEKFGGRKLGAKKTAETAKYA